MVGEYYKFFSLVVLVFFCGSCCKPQIVEFDHIKRREGNGGRTRDFFLVKCPPEDQDSLLRIIDHFNGENKIPVVLFGEKSYSRIFFRETSSTFKEFKENDSYLDNDRLDQHLEDILVEAIWSEKKDGKMIMSYLFYDEREAIFKVLK